MTMLAWLHSGPILEIPALSDDSVLRARGERIALARRRGETVQQHDRRRVLRTRFAIEHSDTINRHSVIGRCRGRRR
jgi:hypothetical protein